MTEGVAAGRAGGQDEAMSRLAAFALFGLLLGLGLGLWSNTSGLVLAGYGLVAALLAGLLALAVGRATGRTPRT